MRRKAGERRMLKQIVFDIGNVLTDFQWEWVLKDCGFSAKARQVLADGIFRNPLWEEYDRGVMGDQAVTAALRKNCAGYEKEFDRVFERFTDLVKERPYSAELVRRLKNRGYGVYILSNYGDTMYRSNAVRFEFLKEVDGAVFSYREKIIKPDPAIYRLLMERFSLKAEETLFLDDRPVNVEGARRTGMKAAVVDSYETIMAALKENGVTV